MTLTEWYNTLKANASSNVPNYAQLTKTELANNYIEAEELCDIATYCGDKKESYNWEHIRSGYYSALLLRYFYKIAQWKKTCASLHKEDEEFVDWLMQAINKACSYQSWRYEYKAIIKEGKFIAWKLDKDGNKIKNPYYYRIDDTAVDKIINRCCYSIRGYWYQYYNKKKRKAEVYSWEQLKETCGDKPEATLDDEYAENPSEQQPQYNARTKYDSGAYDLISRLIKEGDMIDALVADAMLNETTRVKVAGKQQFSQKKLTAVLNAIDAEYATTFLHKYDAVAYRKPLDEEINKIHTECNYINGATEKFSAHMRQRPDLIALLNK